MFIVVLFVIGGMTWLYYDLFRENGEEKLYAFVPIFNFYKICSMVEAVWVFWGYSVAFAGSLILRILAWSIFPELDVVAALLMVVVLLTKIIVYIRLYKRQMYDLKGVTILIFLDTYRIFVGKF